MENNKENLFSFSPYCGIWEHSFPEIVILEYLKNNFNITYMGCNGILNELCIVMMAKGVDSSTPKENKDNICHACINKRKLFEERFDYNFLLIEQYVSHEELRSIEKILESTNEHNWINLQLDGINIGKISMYNIILKYKKNTHTINTAEELNELRINLKNSLISYFAIKNLYQKYIPNIVFTYNNLYPTNNICSAISIKHSICVYSLHAGANWGNRISSMIISKNTIFDHLIQLKQQWDVFKKNKICQKDAKSITKHFESIIYSKLCFNYSSKIVNNFDFYKKFPQAKNKKIFLATLSSSDERFAYNFVGQKDSIYGKLFKKQIDWIRYLIDYFTQKDNYFLIIRVHPRELPNPRLKGISDNALELKKLLIDLPKNIVVNWPDEKISIYNLAHEVDVLLNSHSSSSLDFLFLGLPVVVYDDEILTFPTQLHYFGNTLESYNIAIDDALKNYWSFDRIYNLYKWMNLYLNLSVYDISKSTVYLEKAKTKDEMSLYKRDKNFFFNRDIDSINIDEKEKRLMVEHISSKSIIKTDILGINVDKENDTKYIINEMKKISQALFYANNSKLSRAYSNFLEALKNEHE
jgi:hypothetical protein